MEKDPAAAGPITLTRKPRNAWKTIAVLLAVALVLALICIAFIVSGAMDLGLSLV
jgi:hypothetical protein